jgi:hypothetical protein
MEYLKGQDPLRGLDDQRLRVILKWVFERCVWKLMGMSVRLQEACEMLTLQAEVHLTNIQDGHFIVSLSMAAVSCNKHAFSRNFEHCSTLL